MIHKKCGGRLVLDCTSLYLIQSPSIKITPKGIYPGPVQIDSNKSKSGIKLICSQCQEIFATKEDFDDEIVDTCAICRNNYSPSEIKVTEYSINICIHCINKANTPSKTTSPTKTADKILALYGEILKNADCPTLLTILMKK